MRIRFGDPSKPLGRGASAFCPDRRPVLWRPTSDLKVPTCGDTGRTSVGCRWLQVLGLSKHGANPMRLAQLMLPKAGLRDVREVPEKQVVRQD